MGRSEAGNVLFLGFIRVRGGRAALAWRPRIAQVTRRFNFWTLNCAGQGRWLIRGIRIGSMAEFNYEAWLHEKAGRQMAEEVALWEKHVRRGRLHMIWVCVVEAENMERWRNSPQTPQAKRIQLTPRIKGCGAAAKRAGFAG